MTAVTPGPYVRLCVTDTGHGMEERTLSRIFEPYFTTKEQGEGTGLGLYVVHGIVKQFNGWMDVSSLPAQGTTFTLFFPQVETEVRAEPAAGNTHPTGGETILLVDDDAHLVDTMGEMLASLGYRVIPATSAVDALRIFEEVPDNFDLVVTDQTMPGMTGERLIFRLRGIRPAVPAIVCTGYSATMNSRKARESGIDAFLMKPVERRELACIIRRVLDGAQTSSIPAQAAVINPEKAYRPGVSSALTAPCGSACPNGGP
jgi:CheY-like chemotaxis protein